MTQLRTRRLGRTGLLVTELGFGGASVADIPEGEQTLLRAFSLGINRALLPMPLCFLWLA